MPGQFCVITDDVRLGRDVRIYNFVNLYGCTIGDETRVGTFVEIQKGARVGARCKISSHTFICEGVEIEDEVFVGHGVQFINDRRPRATNPDGTPQSESDWTLERTVVRRGASIGTGAVILGGVEIGERATVGAGAVVTKSVPAGATVVGNPARVMRNADCGLRVGGREPES
ncbi:MAG: N-acetyltransferase [Acidobacteria bacterium]|nr:N-acetyltransferase [Acidobacteriota bacterium]